VPFNSFAGFVPNPNPGHRERRRLVRARRRPPLDRPLLASGPSLRATEGHHLVYALLTKAPNVIIEPIHSKAPPVILTIEEERDAWWQDVIGAALLMVCL
jgi:putative SOS response-associated peptidase YedK